MVNFSFCNFVKLLIKGKRASSYSFKNLLNKDIDFNVPDFYGNTAFHYIVIDKRINYLEYLLNKPDIKYNLSNINGDIPLHILLESESEFKSESELIRRGLERDIRTLKSGLFDGGEFIVGKIYLRVMGGGWAFKNEGSV